MKKLDRAVIIISRIVEVFMWVGTGMSVVIAVLAAVGKPELIRFFTDATSGTDLLISGDFALRALDAQGRPALSAFVIFFITLALTLGLMAMCARNVHLIFKTSEGKTWFSKGETPFQPDNIRMVREIGIFMIAIPAVRFVMSVVARIVLGPDMVESSLGMEKLFVGLVALALSRYFAYGMQLQNDVDGLL
ncbi:MAG: hypothetical protein IJ646_09250 [Clostridia bacterium]|nr:hypothetical protein [Clostridia bacterium]